MGTEAKARAARAAERDRPTRIIHLTSTERMALIDFLSGVKTKNSEDRKRRRFLREALRLTEDDYRSERIGDGFVMTPGLWVGEDFERVFHPLRVGGPRRFEASREALSYLLDLLRPAEIHDRAADLIHGVEERLAAALQGSYQPPKDLRPLSVDDFDAGAAIPTAAVPSATGSEPGE